MITIKGLNDSLVFVFHQGDYNDYLSFLQEKFSTSGQMFSGSKVIFQGRGLAKLSREEVSSLQRLCLDNDMTLNNTPPPAEKPARSHNLTEGKDLIVRRNVRSGQKVHSEGSVVIWGDVHESAEITAARDIIVLGKLGGVAHAGCYGDETSVVFALNLSPSQIRIANKISRAAGDEARRPRPELAYLEEGNICVREYSSQDRLL